MNGSAPRQATLRIFRGDAQGGGEQEYRVPVEAGMVVLDAVHWIQGHLQPDLAVRWNCKAGKCGSCSAEINGMPKLMCKTRLDALPPDRPISVHPMKAFPLIKDLVCDVSWNYRVNRTIPPFEPDESREWRFYQEDVDRAQEMRKCIECFLCQDVCHVLRTHHLGDRFVGPRFFVRAAGLDLHPMDKRSRASFLQREGGLALCNITKCCSEVCPEHIRITDNAIIPEKERAVDELYDPLVRFLRKLFGRVS